MDFFFPVCQVSLPRPVLSALCGAIGEDLPLMSEEVREDDGSEFI